MKRLALLLAAMGIVSVGVMAEEPALKVTNFGQSIEVENVSGNSNIGETWFWNNLGMKYDDWTFSLQFGKQWDLDTDKGVVGNNGRVQLSAVKSFGNYYLGVKTRFQQNYDRYHLLAGWNYENFYGDYDFYYESQQGTDMSSTPDSLKMEIFPVGVKYGDFKAAWFIEGHKSVGGERNDKEESYITNQLRFYAPIYKGEKLTLNTEYRLTLMEDKDVYKPTKGYVTVKDFGRHRVYLKSNYVVNDSLSVFLNYGYQISDYEGNSEEKVKANVDSDRYWGDVEFGWNYKF